MTAPLPTEPVSCAIPRRCDCKGRRYTCPRCRRFVPWCFGAADEFASLCDDCAEQVLDTAEAERWREPVPGLGPQPIEVCS